LSAAVTVALNGEDVELTAEGVRERLRGRTPGEIAVHWVEVEGVRWPVMQAMGLALGEAPSFRSKDARRYFGKLGFPLGESTVRTGAKPQRWDPSIRPRPDAGRFDTATSPILDTVDVSLSFAWRLAGPVEIDPEGHPVFPPLPDRPGLYRFDFGADETGRALWYIGEAKNLRNRAGQYRAAKRDRRRLLTSRRLHLLMVEHLAAGGLIAMAVVTEVTFADGSAVNVGRKSGRLLGESAAVVLAKRDPNVIVLNRDDELAQDVRRAGDEEE
jgi:hypothetical protein